MKIQEPGLPTIRRDLTGSGPPKRPESFSQVMAQTLSQKEEGTPLLIGTITRDTPTISQLLIQSPFKERCWEIIHNPVNADKAYKRILPGTEIRFNPETQELLWGGEQKALPAQKSQPTLSWARETKANLSEFNQENPSEILSQAVKSFIGRNYEQMDCYELLVGGLSKLGVQYSGKDGLGRHLIQKALDKGLPKYHYLNGEGLVSESGTPVFKKTLLGVKNPGIEAQGLMAEMDGLLREGQILSFSMQNKGHTGVISRAGNQWTFINSGQMDHNLSGENGSKKVGEEDLKSEVENWLKLAVELRQGLKITLGSLNIDQLSMFMPSRMSQKA